MWQSDTHQNGHQTDMGRSDEPQHAPLHRVGGDAEAITDLEVTMEPFRIAVAGWGVFIQIRAPLKSNDRNAFIDFLQQARDRMLGNEHVGVLIDLREIDVVGDPDERVRAYVGMVRLLAADRAAIVVSSVSGATRIEETVDAAAVQDIIRVMLPETGTRSALGAALRWVEFRNE